jgi:hypothetical protein
MAKYAGAPSCMYSIVSAISHKLNVSRYKLMWIFFLFSNVELMPKVCLHLSGTFCIFATPNLCACRKICVKTVHILFIYYRHWVHYIGNELNCLLRDYSWLLNTKHQLNMSDHYSKFEENLYFSLGPLVPTSLFSWRYNLCSLFISP